MKDLIIPVNNEAHSRALVSVVGEETAQLVLRAYKAIDSAMVFGYERGLKDAVQAAVDAAETATLNATVEGASWEDIKQAAPSARTAFEVAQKESFKNGYDAGFADGESWDQAAYDDGYVAGVSDARVSPADADREVARLCQYDNFDDESDVEFFANYGDERDDDMPLTILR